MTDIPIIKGDIANANVDCIVQQCNCLTVKPHGLSEHLAKKLGADPYSKRTLQRGRRNVAIAKDRYKPGSIKVYRRRTAPKHLICLFAQFTPGKVGSWYADICQEHGIIETAKQREEWFNECLEKLEKTLNRLGCVTVSFPYYIGCGLAGGDWSTYQRMIVEFAVRNPQLKITFNKL